MKKYGFRIVGILLVISVITNIYFYYQVKEFNTHFSMEYRSSVNHLYGELWDTKRYLDQILEHESEDNLSVTSLTKKVVHIKNSLEEAREEGHEMESFNDSDTTLDRYEVISDFFGIYLNYKFNHIESALHNENYDDLFSLTRDFKDEVTMVLDHLPDRDEEYIKLSDETEEEIWVNIVNELPESEELEVYKTHSFKSLIEYNNRDN